MNGEPLLEVEGLQVAYHSYGRRLRPLHDVSLTVAPGEIVGIVGESGCGKSTLAGALLRLLPANGEIVGGEVLFKGRDLLRLDEQQMRGVRGSQLAMIFQDPSTSLNPTFTVGSHLLEAQRAHAGGRRVSGRELRRRAVEALVSVGIPDAAGRIDSYPYQFSGGQKQRIMIAMALLLQPSLLIADEPTSALDVTLEAQIIGLLRRLRSEQGTAILYVSHDLGLVSRLCDRVVVMYAGAVVEQGPAGDVFERPLHPYTRALLAAIPSLNRPGAALTTIPGRPPSLSMLPPGCAFAERCRYAQSLCRRAEPQLYARQRQLARCFIHDPLHGALWTPEVVTAAEADLGERQPAGPTVVTGGRRPLVEVNELSTVYRHGTRLSLRRRGRRAGVIRAVDGVTLTVGRGETLGLVGESGSGKTTLAESILRLVSTRSGEVVFDGQDVLTMSSRELRALRRRAQIIFQDPHASLSPRQRVGALLTEPYAINRVPRAERYSVSELLEMVGLSSEQARKYPGQLSGGQARRVGIARALAIHPDFIVADEPTSGLDVSAAAAVLNLMQDLQRRLGLTYLLITHSLDVVSAMADRIAVMRLGRLVEIGPAERILTSPEHPYTRALLTAALPQSGAE